MGCVVIMNTDLIGRNFLCQKHDPPSKKKNNKRLTIFSKKFLNLAAKENKKNLVTTRRKKHGTGKLDSERENCGNTFPRVRKQTLLFETGVCID